ncbi:MAG TPA: 3-dehydroquinate synthase [Fimbriiglobus sp.]|jgi:3-dehydroquinate synthase
METVRVSLGPRSYDIVLTRGMPNGLGPFARSAVPQSTTALVVSDENVETHAGRVAEALAEVGIQPFLTIVQAGEETKSLVWLSELYDGLAEMPADRRTLIVAVGGGVIGDLAGFAAATYNRGLPLLMVPTTLLAMVDSSVGGKTGINHATGKNLIGAFHQPAGVWIDTQFLDTLPEREYVSGLAEVVKYGVILDPDFFGFLEGNVRGLLERDPTIIRTIVSRSCRLKADVVEQDEREETGLRAVLNYGHTFAHAFETVAGYGTWQHGEAVAAGMICASELAEKLQMIAPDVTERQSALLRSLGLPIAPLPSWSADELIAAMRRDKKAAAGELRFILPTRIGDVRLVENVPEPLVREVLPSP